MQHACPTGKSRASERNHRTGRSNPRNQSVQTLRRADSTAYRRRAILPFGMGIYRPSFWEDIAVKASLLFVAGLAIAISSIAPANAEATHVTTGATTTSFRSGNAPWIGCSGAAGWTHFSSTCRNLANFKSYNECTPGVAKAAGTSLESWWYCSSLGFTN